MLSVIGKDEVPDTLPDYNFLSLKGIIDYAENTDLEAERELLESQISCNLAVTIEGFLGKYVLNVGRPLLDHTNYRSYVRAVVMAVSGSDGGRAAVRYPW